MMHFLYRRVLQQLGTLPTPVDCVAQIRLLAGPPRPKAENEVVLHIPSFW